jgi:hypothetical protein
MDATNLYDRERHSEEDSDAMSLPRSGLRGGTGRPGDLNTFLHPQR